LRSLSSEGRGSEQNREKNPRHRRRTIVCRTLTVEKQRRRRSSSDRIEVDVETPAGGKRVSREPRLARVDALAILY
jgi:hypothetical protein